jgi:type IV pilus assembly protein PilV
MPHGCEVMLTRSLEAAATRDHAERRYPEAPARGAAQGMRKGPLHGHRHRGGFSLIEVLVAILILSVGILGVGGLQLLSLQNNTNSLQRTRAFIYAYEIIDRARANPGQDYSLAIDAAAPGGADCEIQDCIPSQLRDYDQTIWKNDLAALLPGGNGSVVVAGGTVTVTVQWQDDRSTVGAAPLNVSVTTIL